MLICLRGDVSLGERRALQLLETWVFTALEENILDVSHKIIQSVPYAHNTP